MKRAPSLPPAAALLIAAALLPPAARAANLRAEQRALQFCASIWAPVCGSDGTVYSNDCEAENAGAAPSTEIEDDNVAPGAACRSEAQSISKEPDDVVACFALWDPVCGADGIVYSNDCEAENADALPSTEIEDDNVAPGAECKSEALSVSKEPDDVVACTEEFVPVCGSDGIVYSNECYAEAAGADAPRGIEGPFDDGPAPGDACAYEAEQEGPRGEDPGDDVVACTKEFVPVCGSDGIVYSNKCDADAVGVDASSEIERPADGLAAGDKCAYEEQLVEKGDGEKEDVAGGVVCTEDWSPACGSDGIVYSNKCFAGAAGVDASSRIEKPAKDLTPGTDCVYEEQLVPEGADPGDVVVCTTEWAPVCGSDGVVYPNECDATLAEVEVAYEIDPEDDATKGSECDPDQYAQNVNTPTGGVVCTEDWTPVCGSNGIVYSNKCFAGAAGVDASSKIEKPADDLTSGTDCIYEEQLVEKEKEDGKTETGAETGDETGDNTDAETADAETPDDETPDAETPDAETPDDETPDAETPDAETPDPDPETPADGEGEDEDPLDSGSIVFGTSVSALVVAALAIFV